MANNEGVDIIIKATDQYTATINKISASNELFGKSVKNIEKEIAALQTYMVKLVTAGIKPTSGAIKLLQTNLDQLKTSLVQTQNAANGAGDAISGSANNLKKSNQNWTALSLVVQDLPYGFRGIQNNLPALLGGIAGIGGAAYLAFSAVIATLTALDSGLISFGGKVKLATDYNKEFAQSLAEEKVKLDSLYGVATNVNKSMDDRVAAAKKLKEEYPKLLENFSAEDIAAGKATTAYNKLSAAVVRYAKAQAAQTAIKEIVTKQIQNDLKIAEKELEYKDANISADNRQIEIDKKSLIYAAGTLNLERVRASTIKDNIDGLKAQNKQLDIQLSKFEDIYNANASSELDNTKPGGKTPEQLQRERDQKLLKAQEVQISNYLDTLNQRNKEIAESELKLQEDIATLNAAGFTNYQNAFLANKIRVDAINKKYNDKEIEDARRKDEKIAKDAEIIDNRQLQNSLDALKIESDTALKIANSTGKATSSERIAILEQYKTALYDLASMGGWTAEQLDKISDALIRVDGEIKGSQDNLKDYKITWTDTMNSINKSILDFVANSINYLAESLGKALAGENIQVFKGLALLLADSLIDIGKALVAYAVPVLLALTLLKKPSIPTAIAAIAAGTAAIVAGSFLKSKLSKDNTQKFANGGIVSGPTYGLMGEYPGAASNPEVVAPLDKLQSLIGGAGGNLEARISGNDLLILMNKAGRNNQNTF
jgi:hypothetical protein